MPELVLVRNNAPGPSVFTDSATKDSYEWQGRGDTNGGDLKHIPEDFLKNPHFRRALDRGVFEVVDASPDVMAMVEKQNAAWQKQQDQIAQTALDTLERPIDNDMVGVGCIGPNPRGNGLCGTGVPVRAKERDDRPPLCQMHSHLAAEFILSYGTEIDDDPASDGKAKPIWTRMTVGPALPSQT